MACLAYLFVAVKLGQQDFTKLPLLLGQCGNLCIPAILLVLFLMPVNWIIEAFKWQLSLKRVEPIGFVRALRSSLYGAGVGLFTPNRVGDPFGRVALLKTENKAEAGLMAFQCAFAQQLATIFFGLLGIALLSQEPEFNRYFGNPWVIAAIAVGFGVAMLFVFGQKYLSQFLDNFRVLKRFGFSPALISSVPLSSSLTVVAFSLLRYMVFASQFVLLLYLFGCEADFITAYAAVFTTYLFASLIPVLSVADAGVRSGFGIIFVGAFWNQPAAIALAAHMVWLLNVALPALSAVWFPFFLKDRVRKTA